jgi:asparagine synthase (glutamine-hydrolysing)
MCGIAGMWNQESREPVDALCLRRMADTLRHRGPDDEGTYIDGDLGLAHKRLSILDLQCGHQPMSNEDGSLWIVFNGEIFNHEELRSDLLARGHRFQTRSDTEVILKAYAEHGDECVSSFNGQFAFALWDRNHQRLLLARDRLGVRPLFYTTHRGGLRFASEIKSLLSDPSVPRRVDPVALGQIFTFWFPVAPRTGFAGIEELPPGFILSITREGRRLHRYWSLRFPPAGHSNGTDGRPDAWYADQLISLLDDAVRLRLRADVPVASYLSGGLDSSVVTALCHRHLGGGFRTFSIEFESAAFDETPFQSEVVRRLGTIHSSFRCDGQAISEALPRAVYHAERPMLRTAPVPMMLLARGVHESGIKVVLTGEGADEILAGYDIFKEAKVRRFWARFPGSRRRPLLLQRLYPYLSDLKRTPGYLNSFFGQGLEDTGDPFYSHRPRWRVTEPLRLLYGGALREQLRGYDALDELRDKLPPEFGGWHPLSQAQYLESAFLLPGYILSTQGDRMAMAHSVEGRFPFLDHRVVEFAATIPPRVKLRALREKHVLREAVRGLIPDAIIDRAKQPYRAPDHEALFQAGGGADLTRTVLGTDALAASGLFEPGPLRALAAKASRQPTLGARDTMALTGAVTTQIWHRQFFQGEEVPSWRATPTS